MDKVSLQQSVPAENDRHNNENHPAVTTSLDWTHSETSEFTIRYYIEIRTKERPKGKRKCYM